MKAHFSSIDFLRGLAALMVAFFHFTHHQSIHGVLFRKTDLIYKIGDFGQYGVHVFFVISAFVIPYSMLKYNYSISKIGKFLLKRIIRIEPPYLFSIAWIVLSSLIFSWYLGHSIVVDWNRILYHLGYLIPFTNLHWYNDVYWTLAIEFQYYLFIALTFNLFFEKKETIRALGLTFLALAPLLNNEHFLVAYLPVFGLGILGTLKSSKQISKAYFVFWMIIFLGSIIVFKGVTVGIITFFTLVLILKSNINTKMFNFLGEISYSLYLTHGELGGRIIYFILPFILSFSYQSYLLLIFAMFFSIFGAWLFFLLIEKPSKKYSKQIKE